MSDELLPERAITGAERIKTVRAISAPKGHAEIRRMPRALRACPCCGRELGKRQLKLALIDRLERVTAFGSPAALELMRAAFPEDNPGPNAARGRVGGLLRAARAAVLAAPGAAPEAAPEAADHREVAPGPADALGVHPARGEGPS